MSTRIASYPQAVFDWGSLMLDDNLGPSGSQAWTHRQLAVQYTGGLRSESTLGALTGGSLSLDSLPTANGLIATGAIRMVVISGVLSHYRLVAGTDAESSPLVIRPDDYHASTNARVWKLLDQAVGSGAVSVASVALSVSKTQVAGDIQDLSSLGVFDQTVADRVRVLRDPNGYPLPGGRWYSKQPTDTRASNGVTIVLPHDGDEPGAGRWVLEGYEA